MTIVETSKGKLRGTDEGGLLVFRGIPFTRPPVGERRFRPPEPVDRWDGIRDALTFGPMSLQTVNERMRDIFGTPKEEPRYDEDCLYLNVWTPGLDDARRPVMVWIHGGAFTIGGGSEPVYDGAALAARDAVIVTINYRLGALGFLCHQSLAEGGNPCANFGILDQIAALEWVRDEIAGFGGDPDNVTIFGESAGAMSVGTLLASPRASGLFRRAILQSGAGHNAITVDKAQRVTNLFEKALGAGELSAEKLRSAPATAILAAQQQVELREYERMQRGQELGLLPFQPVIDGMLLSKLPIESIRDGASRDVPVLTGTTLDEWRLFLGVWPQLLSLDEEAAAYRLAWVVARNDDTVRGREALRAYKQAREERGDPVAALDLFMAAMTDQEFRIPMDRLAVAQAAHGSPVFMYRFDWPSPVANGLIGACHALELPFVFGTYGLAPAFVGGGPEADALAKRMGDAWVAFARSSDPSTPEVRWPRFDPERREVVAFGASGCCVETRPQEPERRFWDGIIP